MLSFPSTLNKGGSNLITPQQSNSLKDVLNNSMKSAFNSAISKATSGHGYDTDGIRYDEKPDYNTQVDSTDFTSDASISNENNLLSPGNTYQMTIWTPSHMNESTFAVMNNYRGYIDNVKIEMGNDAEVKGSNGKKYKTYNFKGKLSPSLFNPYHGIPVYGIMENLPLLDGTKGPTHDETIMSSINDCSINELVRLSSVRNTILGHAKYKYADFMYCKDLGKISNNHMITLRKFALPVGDNIFGSSVMQTPDPKNADPMSTVGDIGRMITWFDTDDNKLSDIMSYEYEATWKELNAKITQQNSQEDDQGRGIVGKVINNLSPGYNKGTRQGINSGGLLGALMAKYGLGSDSGTYANNDVALGRNYDNNKVYEPKDTIQDTHIYEGKLKFKQEFTLNFSYKLRAYDNINPKSAFLDLIGNILSVTYRRGTFWGGRNEILGSKPNKGMWNKYNSIMQGISKSGSQFWNNIFHLEGANTDSMLGAISNLFGDLGATINSALGINIQGYADKIASTAKSMVEDPMGTTKSTINAIKGAVQSGAQKAKDLNLGQAVLGSAMNKLGRPALYAFDSLLSGANVGLWHVTIGNPKNPIAVFGNLIMTGAKITHSGPLGFDDFPTDLHVSVTLKHAMSRDAVGIQKMYTKGQNAIYLSMCSPFNTINFNDGKSVTTNVDIKSSNPLPESEVTAATQSASTDQDNSSKQAKVTTEQTSSQSSISKKGKSRISGMDGMASNIDVTGHGILGKKSDPPILTVSNDDLRSLENNLHKNDSRYVPKDLDNISDIKDQDISNVGNNKIYSSRFVFCGTDVQEMISNKDEMR